MRAMSSSEKNKVAGGVQHSRLLSGALRLVRRPSNNLQFPCREKRAQKVRNK